MNFRDDIVPYVPGEQPHIAGIIKLNTNENPYPPSPKVTEAIRSFDCAQLALYPSHRCDKLKNALEVRYGLPSGRVFVGNGSDEVLALCFMAFFNSGKPVFFSDITYSFYRVWCNLLKIPNEEIPLSQDFRINLMDGDAAAYGGVILANPNAPTGIAEDIGFVKGILKKYRDSIVVVDEAYIDFGGESAVSLIDQYPNLVVVHTFSKSRSLAGLRVGYAMAQEPLIAELEKIKYSFNAYPLDSLSLAAAVAAVEDPDYYCKTAQKIIKTRTSFVEQLGALGFQTLPSSANFVFTQALGIDAVHLSDYLKSRKIYVRHFNAPRISNYLRVTIGLPEHMNTLLREIEAYKKTCETLTI